MDMEHSMREIGLVLLSSAIMALLLTYADAKRRTFAAAQTAKQQCINTCRARHRSCLSAKQLPSLMCLGIYQDCTRYTCNAGSAGRPTGLGPE